MFNTRIFALIGLTSMLSCSGDSVPAGVTTANTVSASVSPSPETSSAPSAVVAEPTSSAPVPAPSDQCVH